MSLKPKESSSMHNEQKKMKLTEEMDMEGLLEKAKELSPEDILEKVRFLNRRVQLTGISHEVEVAVDKTIHTWACARIPKKRVESDGIVVTTNNFHYIIVMPYEHLAINDNDFILGELRHELGHALYTDWRMDNKLSKFVESQGYSAELMGSLTNCLEDPRMENVSTKPDKNNGYIKNWFWAKNKTLILPNIGNNIAKMHPVEQFDFLIKLYSLWQIHSDNAEVENFEQWDGLETLHPNVQKIWENIKNELEKIVGIGEYKIPEMRSYVIEESIRNIFWPAKKELIDEFGQPSSDKEDGEQSGEGDEEDGEEGEDGGQSSEGSKKNGKKGKQPIKEGGQHRNPDDIDNLPPEVQKIINNKIEQYKKTIEQQQQQQIEHNKKAKEENEKIRKKMNERLEKKDGIRSAEIRKEYNRLKKQAGIIQRRMSRLFEKYFPKIAYPRNQYSKRGKNYSAREHLKRYGTGFEKPMARPNIPEKSGFVLQLIIDVSGSMSGDRIEEVVKTAIGILEATKDYPIYIEILASDDQNCNSDGVDKNKYVLKTFDEDFGGSASGRIKERLVSTLKNCNGGNDDASSLEVAIPRIEKKKKQLSADYDKIATLTIFLSDAEVEGQQDPAVVNELRKKIPILGGCIEPDPAIKNAVQAAYGPIGEGSFCPSSLVDFPKEFERILRRKIQKLFKN